MPRPPQFPSRESFSEDDRREYDYVYERVRVPCSGLSYEQAATPSWPIGASCSGPGRGGSAPP